MEIKPVKETTPPQYPVKESITAEQIKSQVPKRWFDNKAAKLALGALAAMTLSGCETPPLAGVPTPPETSIPMVSPNSSGSSMVEGVTAGVPQAQTFKVAPLFVHGGGQGAFGCVMVAPPVFLTENEALEVINDAAKAYGLKFAAEGCPEFSGVLEPITNMYDQERDFSQQSYITMMPDFADAEHGVAIEYVSSEDVSDWHQDTGLETSVGTYETKDAAQQLSDAFASAIDTNYTVNTAGVLYDPCELADESELQLSEMSDEQWNEFEQRLDEFQQQSREMSEAQLKKQAVDFFEWLKKQGVI